MFCFLQFLDNILPFFAQLLRRTKQGLSVLDFNHFRIKSHFFSKGEGGTRPPSCSPPESVFPQFRPPLHFFPAFLSSPPLFPTFYAFYMFLNSLAAESGGVPDSILDTHISRNFFNFLFKFTHNFDLSLPHLSPDFLTISTLPSIFLRFFKLKFR